MEWDPELLAKLNGVRRRGRTIYRAALPSDERRIQATKRTHSSIVPLGRHAADRGRVQARTAAVKPQVEIRSGALKHADTEWPSSNC